MLRGEGGGGEREQPAFSFQLSHDNMVCVVAQGTVVEQMSVRCGGFLRTLSLKDCHNVEDAALK